MNLLGEKIRALRSERGLLLRVAASKLDIDPAILSKIENGRRRAKKDLVYSLESLYGQVTGSLVTLWLSDRIVDEVHEEAHPIEALKVAEQALHYGRRTRFNQILPKKHIGRILEAYPQIQKAWIFGSYARGDAGPNSDLDILIEVSEKARITMFDLAEIQLKLRDLFNRKVDIVLSRTLRKDFTEEVHRDKKLIYEIR